MIRVSGPSNVKPRAPTVSQVATDMMSIDACVYDYNKRVNQSGLTGVGIPPSGNPIQTTISGHPGIKTSFSPVNLADQDICGWYFIPDSSGLDDASVQAYKAESDAFTSAQGPLNTAATTGPSGTSGINMLMPQNMGGGAYSGPITLGDSSSIEAVGSYQADLGSRIANMPIGSSAISTAVTTLKPYGWIFAGALLNMVARIQAMISNAATAGMPETHPPSIVDPSKG